MDWIERTLRRTGGGERRFVMLDGLIGFAYLAGDYARAVALGEEELQLARAAGDVRRTIHALDGMAVSTAMLEDHGRARALLEEALRLAREREREPNLLYQLTTNLSGVALARRDWAEVIAYGNEAISIWARLRPGHLAVVPLFNKGFALLEQGRPLEARPLFEESLIGAAKPPRLMGNVAYGLSGLAAVAAETGEPERAALLAGAADSVGESLGMTFDPTEAERHERTLASARAALGPRFAEIYQAGRTVDADSALDVALLAAETQHQRSS